jgi:SAM-dependent methyltransferase
MIRPTEQEIQDAFLKVEAIVAEANNSSDTEYFNFHKKRYLRMVRSIASSAPIGAALLNIGSHYLHTSLLFKFVGYEVHSMDVAVFWDLDFVSNREKAYGLSRIVENDLESLKSQEGITDKYDVILFAEIMEHITFNPVNFWKRVYELLAPLGMIYISTPNSLNLYNVLRTIARILTFRGVGLPIGSIFQNVTYGHHWKEYSASEIRKYFALLSDDFHVDTRYYNYRDYSTEGLYPALMSILSFLGNAMYFLSDEIEAVVRVEKTGSWKLSAPEY